MFDVPNLNNYRKAEFISFVKDYLTILQKYESSTVAEQVSELQQAYKKMTDDYQEMLGSSFTQTIEQLDRERDACYLGIKGVAKAYLNHYDANYAAAAESLIKSMDKYGKNLAILNYQAQTVAIENLLVDWTELPLFDALTLLGLQAWAAKMKEKNTAFESARQERTQESATKTAVPIEVQRPVVVEAYRKVNNLISAHNTIAPAENWTNIIHEHNALVQEYQQIINRRDTKKKDEKK